MQVESSEMKVFTAPESFKKGVKLPFCPGCDHGLAMRLVAEVLDEFNLREKAIAIASIGCSVMLYNYFDVDCVEAPHGRALAAATGAKRVKPDNFVFTYQGDGDLAAIGTNETIHAANRGENLTCIFINNAVYGMTGGQMAPTTLLGQKTATTITGRDQKLHGYPLKISEMLALLPGVKYVERTSMHTAANYANTKNVILKKCLNMLTQIFHA